MRHSLRFGHRAAAATAALVCAATMPAYGCLDRPVVAETPTTKTSITEELSTGGVSKVDLLFDIDNSASMGDKQQYLVKAIPDLIARLVTPSCVDPANGNKVLGPSTDDGTCAEGQLEFPPVHDMHIGIVSSSLGPRLGDHCSPNDDVSVGPQKGLSAHEDDQAHLLARAGSDEHPLADAQPDGFLDWFPSVTANAGLSAGQGSVAQADAGALQQDFADLVTGVHEYGCGVESQLESWYRFLVQPDPYASLTLQNGVATWAGVDTTILQQRHDFLRPDSLVAVIVLSDENDSEIDVRSLGGRAYQFMTAADELPRGTSACATNPNDPSCGSCSVLPPDAGDPACATPYADLTDWGMDLNLRHVHMKQKYGVDPQYPLTRYVTGLTSLTVPDRSGEYPAAGTGNYVGTADCTNPLFAAALPDGTSIDPSTLCNLPPGTRTKDLVFYAHIGGVPYQLLHYVPEDPDASTLTDADWVSILGNDPLHYDYAGIDPHMIESYAPRAGLPPPTAPNDADVISGREWITNQGVRNGAALRVDLEYACTFPIPPRDCTDPANVYACDCLPPGIDGGLSPEETPPVCDSTNPTTQVAAKAYPTIRELLLARLLGTQGVISSICPQDPTEQTPGDPYFGYRPAMATIVGRLKTALTSQCVPHPLVKDESRGGDGLVPCLVLATLPTPGDESACAASPGLSIPEADVLARFRAEKHAAWALGGDASIDVPDPSTFPVCAVNQLGDAELADAGTCVDSKTPGFCYVYGEAAGICAQAILFAPGTPPSGSKIDLQCIEQTSGGDGGP